MFPVAGLRRAVGIASDFRSKGFEFEPQPGHTTFVVVYHEIISTTIHTLPLIKEKQLSLTIESMCTKYWLTAKYLGTVSGGYLTAST